ncbi:MAG: pyridoxal-dependent decarboxylase [Kibdelosporangium sp.]
MITNGGSESDLLGLLLAKKDAAGAPVQVLCAHNTRSGIARAAEQLGMPAPVVVGSVAGIPDALGQIALATVVVVAAGTADTGAVDPLREIGLLCRRRGSWLHVDASGGGAALFSDRLQPLFDGLDLADSVTVELPELGVTTGLLAVRDVGSLTGVRLIAHPEVAAVFRSCRAGLGPAAERRCATAAVLADAVQARDGLRLWARPALWTVVFRPDQADDDLVADLLGRLAGAGPPGVGLVTVDSRVWLRIAVHDRPTSDYLAALDLLDPFRVVGSTPND